MVLVGSGHVPGPDTRTISSVACTLPYFPRVTEKGDVCNNFSPRQQNKGKEILCPNSKHSKELKVNLTEERINLNGSAFEKYLYPYLEYDKIYGFRKILNRKHDVLSIF